jgi:hypothetical protein
VVTTDRWPASRSVWRTHSRKRLAAAPPDPFVFRHAPTSHKAGSLRQTRGGSPASRAAPIVRRANAYR